MLETAIIDSNTDPAGVGNLIEITEVSMLAGADRAGGSHHFQAILIDSSNHQCGRSPHVRG